MWGVLRGWLIKYKVLAALAAAGAALGSVFYVVSVFFRGKYAKPMAELEVRRHNSAVARAVRRERKKLAEQQAEERREADANVAAGRRDHFENDW